MLFIIIIIIIIIIIMVDWALNMNYLCICRAGGEHDRPEPGGGHRRRHLIQCPQMYCLAVREWD